MQFRLLTPESSPARRSAKLVSLLLHAALVAVVVLAPWSQLVPTVAPERKAPLRSVTLAAPPRPFLRRTIRPTPTPVTPAPAAVVPAPRMLPVEPLLAVAVPEPKLPEPKINLPKPMEPPAPIPVPPVPPAPKPAPAITTGIFASAATGPATPQERKVIASGFGDAPVTASRARAVVTETAGFGEAAGTAAVKAARTIASTGFETARAEAPRVARTVATEGVFAPVEILEKPQPVYTEVARRLRVEGAVQLRVVFEASGEIRILGIVRGLGYGLDEAAAAAAARIRFRPARRSGQPVDSPAVVQIVFQLA